MLRGWDRQGHDRPPSLTCTCKREMGMHTNAHFVEARRPMLGTELTGQQKTHSYATCCLYTAPSRTSSSIVRVEISSGRALYTAAASSARLTRRSSSTVRGCIMMKLPSNATCAYLQCPCITRTAWRWRSIYPCHMSVRISWQGPPLYTLPWRPQTESIRTLGLSISRIPTS